MKNKENKQKYVINPIYVIAIIFGITLILFFISAIVNRKDIKKGTMEYNEDFDYTDITTEEDIYHINDIDDSDYESTYQGGDLYEYMVEGSPEMQETKRPVELDEDLNADIDEEILTSADIPQEENFDDANVVVTTEVPIEIESITESNYTTLVIEIINAQDYTNYPISNNLDINAIKNNNDILKSLPHVRIAEDMNENSFEEKKIVVYCSEEVGTEYKLCILTFDLDDKGYLNSFNVTPYTE